MAIINVTMPKLGESITEATVLKLLKQVGDHVQLDEPLMDIATDKVDSEVPSPAEGILEAFLCNENDIITIGTVIARIRNKVPEPATDPFPAQISTDNIHHAVDPEHTKNTLAPSFAVGDRTDNASDRNELVHDFSGNGDVQHPITDDGTAIDQIADQQIPYQPSGYAVPQNKNGIRFYSPLVMNIAAQEGIPLGALENIPGTGNEGRLTKSDLLLYLSKKDSNDATTPTAHPQPPDQRKIPTQSDASPQSVSSMQLSGNVEVVEMDRMRKVIAEHMIRSKATSAHVTSFAEADVTHLVKWREAVKKEFEKREGEKITYTPIFIEAIVRCLKKFPLLNSSVSGDRIIIKKDINIGMATALPNGNLIVPVIKHADQLNIIGLTKQVNRLSGEARKGKLQPADIQEGTFTFTNIGTFGSLMGTPIINQPQVGVLATGAIKKKPVVIESEKGDSIAIRHMMFVSMSYDHRIIDGGLGSAFLEEFVKVLEAFDINRSF